MRILLWGQRGTWLDPEFFTILGTWVNPIQPQVSIFAWKFFHNKLHLSVSAQSVGVQLAPCCLFCKCHGDTKKALLWMFLLYECLDQVIPSAGNSFPTFLYRHSRHLEWHLAKLLLCKLQRPEKYPHYISLCFMESQKYSCIQRHFSFNSWSLLYGKGGLFYGPQKDTQAFHYCPAFSLLHFLTNTGTRFSQCLVRTFSFLLAIWLLFIESFIYMVVCLGAPWSGSLCLFPSLFNSIFVLKQKK